MKPDYIFIENVPGIQKIDKEKDGPYKRFINFIRSEKYEFVEFIARSEEYGVPQRRKRFVLLASRIGKIGLLKKLMDLDICLTQQYVTILVIFLQYKQVS